MHKNEFGQKLSIGFFWVFLKLSFQFCHHFRFRVLLQFECLVFIAIRVLSFVARWVFEYCCFFLDYTFIFFSLSIFQFLSFVKKIINFFCDLCFCFRVLMNRFFAFCHNFHQLGSLGQVGLVVAMSVHFMSPFHVTFF